MANICPCDDTNRAFHTLCFRLDAKQVMNLKIHLQNYLLYDITHVFISKFSLLLGPEVFTGVK